MLTDAEKQAIVARVASVESATGVEVVTAVVARADAYPESIWTAFALAASLAGLAVVALDLLRPSWATTYLALMHVVPVLGMGAASALCAAFVPAYARLFVRPSRRAAEVRQYAQCLFLDHDLGRTRARTAVLLLVARFERRVELVADRGFAGRISPAEWDTVVDATTGRLGHGACADALLVGLDRLEALLRERGYARRGAGDELPDAPLEAA